MINPCTKYEEGRQYTQNGIGGGYTPIPAIQFIHFKVFGDKHGLELHTTGNISMNSGGVFSEFLHIHLYTAVSSICCQDHPTLFPECA